jgi:hypothetical protein
MPIALKQLFRASLAWAQGTCPSNKGGDGGAGAGNPRELQPAQSSRGTAGTAPNMGGPVGANVGAVLRITYTREHAAKGRNHA